MTAGASVNALDAPHADMINTLTCTAWRPRSKRSPGSIPLWRFSSAWAHRLPLVRLRTARGVASNGHVRYHFAGDSGSRRHQPIATAPPLEFRRLAGVGYRVL